MSEIKCPHCGGIIDVDNDQYAKLLNQVRDDAFNKALKERVEEGVQLAVEKERRTKQEELSKKQEEITKLQAQRAQAEQEKQLALQQEKSKSREELFKKQEEIAALNAKLQGADTDKKLAVNEAESKLKDELNKKDAAILQLKGEIALEEEKSVAREQLLKDRHAEELRAKQEQVDYYKDLKTKLSVKLLGENLEQHCEIAFNQIRAMGFKNAYFEKDNEVSESGSKGDFIFRDYDDEHNEILSIMFEMKNEGEGTKTKKKNEDFFKELDKDRREKKCEYAVLVTLLEADNELYNSGIVDVSHKYDKMYVIRPQFFIPMITILRNSALKSVELKKQLVLAQNQSVDVTRFEENLENFKDAFGKNYRIASEKFQDAIAEIDKTIDHLQKVKESLLGSERQLRLANDKAEKITLKRLTAGAPSVEKMFEENKSEG